MHDGMMMGGPMMMVVGLLVMSVVAAALIAGVVGLVRTLTRGQPSPRPDVLGELQLRYARGEIDRDEFLQRRDDLERTGDERYRGFRGGA